MSLSTNIIDQAKNVVRAAATPPYAVFRNDLNLGVTALARAIGVRQAGDMLKIAERPQSRDASIDSQNVMIFPAGDCASAILALCNAAQPFVDMDPIADLLRGFDDRPIREHWPGYHEWLSVLADLTSGMHLVIQYTKDEKLAVARLYAALHLMLCGPLPVSNHGVRRSDFVGCPKCIAEYKNHYQASLLHAIGIAARDGELDPAYTPPVFAPEHRFGDPWHDLRVRKVRLTWKAERPDSAIHIRRTLQALGYEAAINPLNNTVVGQRPLIDSIQEFMTPAEHMFRHLADVQWYGAETIFTLDRTPLQ